MHRLSILYARTPQYDYSDGENSLSGNTKDGFGAYGLRLTEISDTSLLVSAPKNWPEWRFEWSARPFVGPMSWSDELAELRILPTGTARIERHAQLTTLHIPDMYTEGALLHPHLGSTAVSVATWAGRCSLHAGSFVKDGGVWAILGDREAGKSSSLAWLISHGYGIAADDLLITDGSTVQVGPRFIDLRQGAAERFGMGADIGVVGTRRRWRVGLTALPAELPLRGWIELHWGPAISVTRIPVEERLAALGRNRGLNLTINDGVSMLRVMSLPAVRFTRPQNWGAIDDAMTELLSALS